MTTDPVVAVDVAVAVAVVKVGAAVGAAHRLWLQDVVAEAWALCPRTITVTRTGDGEGAKTNADFRAMFVKGS